MTPVQRKLAPAQELEVRRMLLLFGAAERGSVSFALYTSVLDRGEVARGVQRKYGEKFRELFLRTTDTDPVRALQGVKLKFKGVVFVYDLEQLDEAAYRTLNLRREALGEIPHALVFWVRLEGLRRAGTEAPDFSRWQSTIFDLRAEPERAPLEAVPYVLTDGFIYKDKADLERRVSLYYGLLEEYDSSPPASEEILVTLLNHLGNALRVLGRWEEVKEVWNRGLKMAYLPEHHAALYGNLGVLYMDKGDLEAAEEMFRSALSIYERLGRQKGIGNQYGNLASLYRNRGELVQAEEMYKKSLAIAGAIGHLEGMAIDYGNLGILHRMRGELDRAEEMHHRALCINKDLGRKEGMASDHGNLGNLYRMKGDRALAEEMYAKALALNEELGRKEGMASNYGNLGILSQDRGDMEQAEQLYCKALAINDELGRMEGVANQYGNLGSLYQVWGELERAEEMYRKSLAIEEEMDHKEGMAIDYANLGILYETCGEMERVGEMWEKSAGLYRELGNQGQAEKVEGWIKEMK